MNALKETIEKLRQSGTIGLTDLKSLKMSDLEQLSEEIKYWCLYGNGKPEKLGKKHKEH
ncbi:hypothetical protein [Polynucleobacter campilacus]|uniref:hypothetical protein n=1 Tax=Polynucleobacter campilacus TaxID=1743163 RepID=UPI00137470CF|nr:hypothetical protein [Polynucleobacter campilacus]